MKSDRNTTVKRHVKGKRKIVDLNAPPIQPDYAQYYNVVDINDRDSAGYSCSIRTCRWYLRVFFWLLDRVVHSCFIILVTIGRYEWLKYRDLNGNDRRKFQIDLSLAVMKCGIKYDWLAPFDEKNKPEWLRQKSYVPCACGV